MGLKSRSAKRSCSNPPAAVDSIVDAAIGFPFIGNMSMPIDVTILRRALLGARELGLEIGCRGGDAYRRLHT